MSEYLEKWAEEWRNAPSPVIKELEGGYRIHQSPDPQSLAPYVLKTSDGRRIAVASRIGFLELYLQRILKGGK